MHRVAFVLIISCICIVDSLDITVPSPSYPTINDAISSATSGTTIFLAAGIFTSCNITITLQNLTIIGNGPLSTIMDCSNNPQGAFCVSASNAIFHLKGIGFHGARETSGSALAVLGKNLSILTITDCAFINNTAEFGGAIFVSVSDYSNVEIKGCYFEHNTATNSALLGGGAIAIASQFAIQNALDLSIRHCIFVNNTAVFTGSGVAMAFFSSVQNAIIEMDGNTFNRNAIGGGSIYIDFINTVTSSNIKVSNSQFLSNTGQNIAAGTYIHFSAGCSSTSTKIFGCIFFSNENGGFYVRSDGPVQVHSEFQLSNNTFLQNSALQGGGAEFFFADTVSGAAFLVQNSTFTSNRAMLGGGLLLLFYNAVQNIKINLNNNVYTNNAAVSSSGGGGGASIFFVDIAQDSSLSMIQETHIENFGGAGGGLQLYFTSSTSNITISMQQCYFWRNTGSTGGAIYLGMQGFSNTTGLQIDDSFCINNRASEAGGGGISISRNASSVDASIAITNTNLVNNKAAQGGGGIDIEFYDDTLRPSLIFSNNYITNNSAFYSGGGGSIWFNGFTTQAHVTLSNVTAVRNNAYESGGAIFCHFVAASTFSKISIIQGNYEGNNALFSAGGAIGVLFHVSTVNNSVTVMGGTYTNNEAHGGGALALYSTAYDLNIQILVENGNYSNNRCVKGEGGGIAISFNQISNFVTIIIANSVLSNNYALNGGGGLGIIFSLQLGSANVFIQNMSLISNSASGVGGGASILLPAGVSINECSLCHINATSKQFMPPSDPKCRFTQNSDFCTQILFTDNNHITNAFVPYNQSAFLKMENVTVDKNIADCRGCMGGGLALSNGQIELSNITFTENVAFQQAGALYTAGTSDLTFTNSIELQNNNARTQTSVLLSSAGFVKIMGSFHITTAVPMDFSLSQGRFEATAFIQTGEYVISPLGQLKIECPRGFQYFDSSLGKIPSFFIDWPNPMITSTNSSSCIACGANFYSVLGGNATIMDNGKYTVVENVECLACPFGAECNQGKDVISASENYWGSVYYDDSNSHWSFTRCPLGYCCQNSSCQLSSSNSSSSICVDGRDPRVPLCGACLPGFSQNLRGNGCSPNSECDDIKWVWTIVFVLALLWCIITLATTPPTFLLASSSPSSSKCSPMDTSWVFPVLMFFFQNVALLFDANGAWPSSMLAIIATITNLQFMNSNMDNSWANMCILPNVTTHGAIALKLVMPLVITIDMILMYILVKILEKFNFFFREKRFSARFFPATLRLVLFLYTSIASVLGVLLHCTTITDTSVVFMAGGVTCYTNWQKGLWAVFAIIVVPFPIAVLCTQLYARKRVKVFCILDCFKALEDTYRHDRFYWVPVLLMMRLLLAIVYSFVEDPASQGILFSIFFIIFLVIHIIAAPYRSWNGNFVQSLSLSAMLLVSLCVLRNETYFSAAVVVSPTTTPAIARISKILDVVQTVVFFVPIGVTLLMFAIAKIPNIGEITKRYGKSDVELVGVDPDETIAKLEEEVKTLRRRLGEKVTS